MTDWNDRRSEPRIPIDTSQLRVINTETDQSLGILANLSSHGMMLHTQQPVAEQASHQIRLSWSKDDGQPREIAVGIHVLWCSEGPGTGYWVGCEIIDISEADQKVLEDLLDSASDS